MIEFGIGLNKKSSKPCTSKMEVSKKVLHSKSPLSAIDTRKLDLEIERLEALKNSLICKMAGKTWPMSESDYSRRRDELNRLLKRDEQEIKEIVQERDQARKDKKNVESAFADYQEKYERVLKTLLTLKEKEDLLKERDHENMVKEGNDAKVKWLDEELEKFKENAKRQVEGEYQSWLSRLAEAEATNMRLKALIRKAEMKVEKLEHDLGQKDKENNELHNLCDELIQSSSSRKSSRQD